MIYSIICNYFLKHIYYLAYITLSLEVSLIILYLNVFCLIVTMLGIDFKLFKDISHIDRSMYRKYLLLVPSVLDILKIIKK